MNPGGCTVEVTGLSPIATEKDVLDFFAFSGAIELVEIVRYSSYSVSSISFHVLESLTDLSICD